MSRTNGHLLQVSNLHLEREGHEILRGVNLVIDRGTVHVVLGGRRGKAARRRAGLRAVLAPVRGWSETRAVITCERRSETCPN